jgi:TonB family protein
MRTPIQTLLVPLLFALPICFAQTSAPSSIPKFSDYRVSQVYNGKNATPKVTDDWRYMRTRIREESRKPPNFAGCDRFVTSGCGTDCASSLVINLRTGDVYDPPYGTFSKDWYPNWSGKGFEFHVNSRLLVADGGFEKCGIHYYEWKGDDFQLIATVTERRVTNPPASAQARVHMTQDQLCCITSNAVSPLYPREARLAGIQGEVKLLLVISEDNSIAELQVISGDRLLVESTIKAVRQWRFLIGAYLVGALRETEVPLTFTFKIEDSPKPAYLHLKNNKVIRADDVREFLDGIEYRADGSIHHISSDSVTGIDACARASLIVKPKEKEEADCIPAGGPSFVIRAIPFVSGH